MHGLSVLNSFQLSCNLPKQIVLVWDFIVKDNLQAVASIRPVIDHEEDDPHPTMPWLDIRNCNCNCSRYLNRGSLIKNHKTDNVPDDSDDACTPDEDDVLYNNTYEEQFTETFRLRGTSFRDHFQNVLRKCKLLQLSGTEPVLTLCFEPINKRDENTLVVLAKFSYSIEPIGYVPGERVQKLINAYKAKQITSIKMSLIKLMYNYYVGHRVYTVSVSMSKKGGTWPPNSKNYEYNCIFWLPHDRNKYVFYLSSLQTVGHLLP